MIKLHASIQSIPVEIEKILQRYVEDDVDAARVLLLKVAHTIPQSYRSIRAPIYRGCTLRGATLEKLLSTGAKIKDYRITSWSYDSKEASNFAMMSVGRQFPRPIGVLLEKSESNSVVINMIDNIKRFRAELRNALEIYDQQEILVSAPNDFYAPQQVKAAALCKEHFMFFNRELGWKFRAEFKGGSRILIGSPATKPTILRYAF
jgi:hypothetical protein